MHFNAGGARLAALQLAQMSWFDRRWVLLQLPVLQRHEVKAALAELRALNISNKAELLQQLLGSQALAQQNAGTVFLQQLSAFVATEPNPMTPASKALLTLCLEHATESGK